MMKTDPHTPMDWDPESLWLKSRIFVDRATHYTPDHALHAFWSSLALEMPARAALSHVHPTLLADPRNPNSLFYALGLPTSEQPRSIPAHSVYARLKGIIPEFGDEEKELCESLSLRRNKELHTASEPFVAVEQREWIPGYYATCGVLCTHLGKSLADYFGQERATVAQEWIEAMRAGKESDVLSRIKKYRNKFEKMNSEEQEKTRTAAKIAVTMVQSPGTIVQECPACSGDAVLHGDLTREESPRFVGGKILVRQHFVSRDLRCGICGLSIEGRSEIVHTKVDIQFTRERNATLHEMFEEDLIDGYMNM